MHVRVLACTCARTCVCECTYLRVTRERLASAVKLLVSGTAGLEQVLPQTRGRLVGHLHSILEKRHWDWNGTEINDTSRMAYYIVVY